MDLLPLCVPFHNPVVKIVNHLHIIIKHIQAVIVSDDGITSYDAAQYALDHGIGMVVVNHAAVERAGLKAMVPWLQERMKDAEAVWLHDGFHIHYYMNKVGC